MLLQNPILSRIHTHLTEINDNLLHGNDLVTDCKVYNEKKDNKVKFILTDFSPRITTQSSIILKDFIYDGKLEFELDLKTGNIVINEFPTLQNKGAYAERQDRIFLFTSDLANLVKKQAEKFIEADELNLVFKSQLALVAIDDKVSSVFPNIINSRTYNSLKNYMQAIDKEIKDIETRVKTEKAHKDRVLHNQEFAINKKTKVMGISPLDYTNQDEFDQAMREKLLEYYNKNVKNIKRHLKAIKTKYIDLLVSYNMSRKNAERIFKVDISAGGVKDLIERYNREQGYKFRRSVRYDCGELAKTYTPADDIDHRTDAHEEAYVFFLYNFVGFFNEEFDYDNYAFEIKWNEISLLKNQYLEDEDDNDGELKHPIFNKSNFYTNGNTSPDKIKNTVAKGWELLADYIKLEDKLKVYTQLLAKVEQGEDVLLNFSKTDSSFGMLHLLPSWIRFSRKYRNHDTTTVDLGDNYHMIMVKPGTTDIDLYKLRNFTVKNGYEFGKRGEDRQEVLNRLNRLKPELKERVEKLIVTIPNSLSPKSIKQITDWIKVVGVRVIYLCEGFDAISKLKSARFSQEIDKIKSEGVEKYEEDFKKGQCSIYGPTRNKRYEDIVIDRDYYNKFMATTPHNITLFHKLIAKWFLNNIIYKVEKETEIFQKEFLPRFLEDALNEGEKSSEFSKNEIQSTIEFTLQTELNNCKNENGDIDYSKFNISNFEKLLFDGEDILLQCIKDGKDYKGKNIYLAPSLLFYKPLKGYNYVEFPKTVEFSSCLSCLDDDLEPDLRSLVNHIALAFGDARVYDIRKLIDHLSNFVGLSKDELKNKIEDSLKPFKLDTKYSLKNHERYKKYISKQEEATNRRVMQDVVAEYLDYLNEKYNKNINGRDTICDDIENVIGDKKEFIITSFNGEIQDKREKVINDITKLYIPEIVEKNIHQNVIELYRRNNWKVKISKEDCVSILQKFIVDYLSNNKEALELYDFALAIVNIPF